MQTVWDFLVKGGITMIPLGLCSIIGLAIVIEKIITLRRSRILTPEVVAVVDGLNKSEDVPLVLSICEKHNGPLPNIVRTALENRHLPKEEMKEVIIDQGRQEIRALEHGLGALETVAAVSPLLGLFGTVLGIFKIFQVISRMGVGQASALSGGISEAVITTITGLAIAIPTSVAYYYFTNRAENLILDIEKHTTTLMRKISSFQTNAVVDEKSM
ncbi:MAG: MotA/TolQ/ExbB proton channel family protein [candidate division KSB1 bacterium]|nr:MotA/TolQ/ExbB proton channel family protein [candidate division KSB1 bacterium]MDZ7303282.1 MotA/TolQ/ExbB proton channel family protein [candidate division KSB1 bacterium]MDZ7312586.1 MotA/TolQ/ExbB proton channel family protein [candidate division KSB1 bacterium]